MDFKNYKRKPFDVEAVEITEENFDEIAKLIGREVRENENGVKQIIVEPRVIPTVKRVSIGWFLTRVGDNYRCYAPELFAEQFAAYDEALTHNVFDQRVGAGLPGMD